LLTQENDVEIHALAARGWNQSAISRHTDRDRKTIRKYLAAGEVPGRQRAASCLEPFRGYLEARFEEDKHVDGTVIYRELVAAACEPASGRTYLGGASAANARAPVRR
jgi:hypothetical protein